MKFSTQDILRIRGTLILLSLALAVGAAAVYGSNKLLNDAKQSKATADREWAEALSKLERVKVEEENLRGYYQQYQTLVARDVIGPERRLDWIEVIEKIERIFRNYFSFHRHVLNLTVKLHFRGLICFWDCLGAWR